RRLPIRLELTRATVEFALSGSKPGAWKPAATAALPRVHFAVADPSDCAGTVARWDTPLVLAAIATPLAAIATNPVATSAQRPTRTTRLHPVVILIRTSPASHRTAASRLSSG